MKKTIITILIIILLASTITASPISGILGWAISIKQGTWSVKALCTASAGPACEGAQFAMDPKGHVTGKGLGALSETSPELGETIGVVTDPQGAITQKALTEIAKENPDTAEGLGEALATTEQLKALGATNAEAKFDNEGKTLSEGSFEVKKGGIGNLIGPDIKEEDILAKSVKFDKKDGVTKLTFTGDDSNIDFTQGSKFENIRKQDENTDAFVNYSGLKP